MRRDRPKRSETPPADGGGAAQLRTPPILNDPDLEHPHLQEASATVVEGLPPPPLQGRNFAADAADRIAVRIAAARQTAPQTESNSQRAATPPRTTRPVTPTRFQRGTPAPRAHMPPAEGEAGNTIDITDPRAAPTTLAELATVAGIHEEELAGLTANELEELTKVELGINVVARARLRKQHEAVRKLASSNGKIEDKSIEINRFGGWVTPRRLMMACLIVCAVVGGARALADPEDSTVVAVPDPGSFRRCADPDAGGTLVEQFPRYDFGGQKVSAKMTDYLWFRWNDQCDAAPVLCIQDDRYRPEGSEWGSPCDPGCYQLDVDVHPNTDAPADNAGRYVQGAVIYTVVWFALAVLVLVLGCSCSTWTLCVCCGRCHKRPKTKAQVDDDGYKMKKRAGDSCWYGGCCRTLLQASVVLPLLLCFVFLWVGHAKGNTQFVPSVQKIIESPRGFAALADDAFVIADDVAEIGQEILTEIIAVNRTVANVIDFGEIATAMGCIEAMLLGLPDVSAIVAELQRTKFGLGLIPSATDMTAVLNGMKGKISDIQALLGTTTSHLTSTQASLTTLTGCDSHYPTCSGVLMAFGSNLTAGVSRLEAAKSSAVHLQSNITSFLALRPTAALADLQTKITEMQSTPSAYDPYNGPKRVALISNVTTVITALRSMETAVVDLIAAIGATETSVSSIDFTTVLDSETLVGTALAQVNASLIQIGSTLTQIDSTLSTFSVAALKATLASVTNVTSNYMPNTSMITFELSKIDQVVASLGCVTPLVTIVKNVNTTLMRVPPESDMILEMLEQTNGLATLMGNATGDVTAQLSTFTDSTAMVDSMNTSEWTGQIDSLQTQMTTVNFSSITSQLSGMDALLASAGGGDTRAQLEAANTSLGSVDLSIPSDMCCNSSSALGGFANTSGAAADTLGVFKTNAERSSPYPIPAANLQAGDIATLLDAVETSLSALDALSPISSALQPLIDVAAIDSSSVNSLLQSAHNNIVDGGASLSSAGSMISSIDTELSGGNAIFDTVDTQWATVSGTFDAIVPMLDDAIEMVLGSVYYLDFSLARHVLTRSVFTGQPTHWMLCRPTRSNKCEPSTEWLIS